MIYYSIISYNNIQYNNVYMHPHARNVSYGACPASHPCLMHPITIIVTTTSIITIIIMIITITISITISTSITTMIRIAYDMLL